MLRERKAALCIGSRGDVRRELPYPDIFVAAAQKKKPRTARQGGAAVVPWESVRIELDDDPTSAIDPRRCRKLGSRYCSLLVTLRRSFQGSAETERVIVVRGGILRDWTGGVADRVLRPWTVGRTGGHADLCNVETLVRSCLAARDYVHARLGKRDPCDQRTGRAD